MDEQSEIVKWRTISKTILMNSTNETMKGINPLDFKGCLLINKTENENKTITERQTAPGNTLIHASALLCSTISAVAFKACLDVCGWII
jgi:hypothetical protein